LLSSAPHSTCSCTSCSAASLRGLSPTQKACSLGCFGFRRGRAIIVYKISAPLRFLEVDLPSGVRSFGYYWARRNYNVYHWVSEDNKTIVFYFNVSRSTEILDDRVYWQDMIVDIALFSDGKMEVLDEEEIPPDMNSEDRRLIEKTKKEILSNAKEITAELEKRTLSLAQKFPNL
jgi:hypothetical protein